MCANLSTIKMCNCYFTLRESENFNFPVFRFELTVSILSGKKVNKWATTETNLNISMVYTLEVAVFL